MKFIFKIIRFFRVRKENQLLAKVKKAKEDYLSAMRNWIDSPEMAHSQALSEVVRTEEIYKKANETYTNFIK